MKIPEKNIGIIFIIAFSIVHILLHGLFLTSHPLITVDGSIYVTQVLRKLNAEGPLFNLQYHPGASFQVYIMAQLISVFYSGIRSVANIELLARSINMLFSLGYYILVFFLIRKYISLKIAIISLIFLIIHPLAFSLSHAMKNIKKRAKKKK